MFKGSVTVSEIAVQPDYSDAERYKIAKNGAVIDRSTGRFVANPPGGPTTGIKDSSQAVALARQRWDKMVDSAELGAVDRVGGVTGFDVWAKTAGNIAMIATTSQKREGLEAAKVLGRMINAWPERGNQAPGVTNNVQFSMSNDLAHRLWDIIENRTT